MWPRWGLSTRLQIILTQDQDSTSPQRICKPRQATARLVRQSERIYGHLKASLWDRLLDLVVTPSRTVLSLMQKARVALASAVKSRRIRTQALVSTTMATNSYSTRVPQSALAARSAPTSGRATPKRISQDPASTHKTRTPLATPSRGRPQWGPNTSLRRTLTQDPASTPVILKPPRLSLQT